MDLVNFNSYNIRTTAYNGELQYSVIDVIGALTDSKNPSQYWRTLRKRLLEEGSQVVSNCNRLKLPAKDGKFYATDCASKEVVLRLIQSIPSASVEPFKLFLANAGATHIEETENPDQLFTRLMDSYRAQGRTDDWIQARIRALSARNQLTETWKDRDVKGKEYAILTDEIHNGTFDMTTKDHKTYKGLSPKDSLRENMSDLELVFTTLSETLTREMAERLDARGFDQNRNVAREAGEQTGESRKRLEKKTGISVVSKSKWLKKGD